MQQTLEVLLVARSSTGRPSPEWASGTTAGLLKLNPSVFPADARKEIVSSTKQPSNEVKSRRKKP